MKKVVVTGATSMIGVALIEECVKNSIEVLAIVRGQSTRMSRLPKSDLITIKECSLDRLNSMEATNDTYDVFYHFAWDYTTKENRDNPILQEKNVKYTLDAVELAYRLGCKKFVGAGSQAEYGIVKGMIDEETRVNPLISYGIVKYTAGKLVAKLCEKYKMQYVWGRIFSVYGKNDNEGTLINYALEKFNNGETAIFSAAIQKWNFLNEIDAGRMFYLVGEKNVESGIYCIANNESKVLREYIEELIRAYGKECRYEFATEDKGKKSISLEVDMRKTINAINYIPQITFSEGIQDVIKNWGVGKNLPKRYEFMQYISERRYVA